MVIQYYRTLLSEITKSQPHTAFSVLTHSILSKWTYLSQVTPNIGHLLTSLNTVLGMDLLPALTGRPPPIDLECDLFAQPLRFGGLGIRIASRIADRVLQFSLSIIFSKKTSLQNSGKTSPSSAGKTRIRVSRKRMICII